MRPISPDDLLNSRGVCYAWGGITHMTLWRWRRYLGFPPPDETINGRNYWRRRTALGWKPPKSETHAAPMLASPAKAATKKAALKAKDARRGRWAKRRR